MHQPVLLQETIENLITDPHGTYVDCTLGGGGHLGLLTAKLAPDATVVGIDKDADTLEHTRLELNAANVTLVKSDFRYLDKVLDDLGISRVDGIMLDLGVSSFQLDISERGFSFHEDARLDMRMNREQKLTAWDIVNCWGEEEITRILFDYGEENHARSISKAILKYRGQQPINTTLELAEIIREAVPARYRREKHPARKSFQALRMAVNEELEALREVLPQATAALKPGGRLCVISFHSLEDRIVKRFFQEQSRQCTCPPDFPVCICGCQPPLRVVHRRPIIPTEEEIACNPRARSAKLRVAERI
ncbi:MAG: 16S rRNA (cytosine(1402)-N(4))-methyltransferase RsmH [Syntrophomonadaceae bacterium]